ncbi:DUF6916 family protein [Cellulomonas biazotea]|uniref:DUF6916 domain-containing protein n=1 Tax=Cellulomonas biazotea TaxID=1709 RepID=A0A402DTL2_9CELL|nr:hypothetical protein [Cellulomonas biazotea]GCE77455.1 hypothetical protein CBZ_25110 [Cellulomonas biazotea]
MLSRRAVVSRRTVLAGGAGAVAVGAVAAVVGVPLLRRTVPLELAAVRALVGGRFTTDVEGTMHVLTLAAVSGPAGAAPTSDAFALTFRAASTRDLPGAVRTLAHDDGDLVLYVGPVGPDGTDLEAVVDRTV